MKLFSQLGLRLMLFVFLIGGICAKGSAQRTVTGTITDKETNEPLIGVTIIEKGSNNNGAISDYDGNFSITVPKNATNLVISYTGYETQEPSIEGINRLDLMLSTSSVLKEVIVIGYGTVKREDATGLVQTVDSKQFNRGAITGAQDLLAGKIAGVTITPSGSPGGGSAIRIRGESSLSASNDPLIVIDGVPIDNGDISGGRNALNFINPNDIETFTVLKDASATAIYGNRASAGVILITTKKGSLGKKIRVDLNTNVSFGHGTKRIDVLTGDEYRALITARARIDSSTTPPTPALTPVKAFGLLGTANTNWQDEIYQTAVGTDHTLGFSGGVGNVPYRASIGFTNKDGLLKTDNFKRYTAGINLSPGFLDNTLQLNLSFKGMLNDNHFADNGAIGSAVAFDPTRPVYSDTTAYGGYTTWTIPSNGTPNTLAPANPLALLEMRNDNSTVTRYIANATVDYRLPFLPALRANLAVGYDQSHGEGTVVVPNTASFAFDLINGGGVNNSYDQDKNNSVLETYLNYKKSFGDHDIDLMSGYSWQHFKVNNSYRNNDSAGTPSEMTADTSGAELFLVSVYSRLNYGYKNRFLFTASIRQDATSRFAPDFRVGLFPAAAIAVKAIDQPNRRYLNSLKVRLSWGLTGQQDIGDYYAYQARYQRGFDNARYQFGDQFVTTIRPNGYVANIQWEEAETYNLGFDMGLIKNRMSATVDIYRRYTKNLLNGIQAAAGSNLTDYIVQNIGNMETDGIELSLNTTPVRSRNFQWDFNANMAYNTSTVTKLINGNDPNYQGVNVGGIAGGVGSTIQNHQTGYQPYSFFVYQQKYDADGKYLPGQYVDRNGDDVITEADKYRYKGRAPRYTFGITNNFTIKNFDIAFAGRANFGNYMYNNVLTDQGYLARLYHPTGYLLNVPSATLDLNVEKQSDLTFSDHFVSNASFFRMDHITIGYNFTTLGKNTFRVYTTVQNAFLVTQYKGIDPEQFGGIDGNVYPRPRTFVVGCNVQF